jgi:hypothetical protein
MLDSESLYEVEAGVVIVTETPTQIGDYIQQCLSQSQMAIQF